MADTPVISIQLSSAPDIRLNYAVSDTLTESFSTSRSQSSAETVATSDTNEISTSFSHAHTLGVEIGFSQEVTGHTTGSVSTTSAHIDFKVESQFTKTDGNTQSWTQEQSQENTTALEEGEAFEASNDIATSSGYLGVTVQISNGGNVSYSVHNLFLASTYLDLSLANPIVPIVNMGFGFEGISEIPQFILAPGESTVDFNFSSNGLSIATTKALPADSQGLVIRPAIIDLFDAEGISYAHKTEGIQSQDATVIIDFGGVGLRKDISHMAATNNTAGSPGISIENLQLNFNGEDIVNRPSLETSEEARHICGTWRSRNTSLGSDETPSINEEFQLETIAGPLPTWYKRNTYAFDTNVSDEIPDQCDVDGSGNGLDVFADSAIYDIDPVTGGAIFSVNVPSKVACYNIRLKTYEYDLTNKEYSNVAHPVSDVTNSTITNVDEAEICRNEDGIWTISSRKLLGYGKYDPGFNGSPVRPSTTKNNDNFIHWRARPMVWDNRSSNAGTLVTEYKIEVTAP